jgi:acetoin utilization deacetylase AcuC-like enzyme
MGAHKKDGDEQSMPGNIVEIILPKICHKDDIEKIFDNRIGSRVEEFKPDIILLSLSPDSEITQNLPQLVVEYVNEKILRSGAENIQWSLCLYS